MLCSIVAEDAKKIETSSEHQYLCEVKPQARAALVQRCRSSVVQWLPLPFFLNLSFRFLPSSLPKLLLWKLHSFDSSLTEWPHCKCETFSFTLFPPLPLSRREVIKWPLSWPEWEKQMDDPLHISVLASPQSPLLENPEKGFLSMIFRKYS